jgi:N-methylhydantoinase B
MTAPNLNTRAAPAGDDAIDAITFEVVRNKLQAITEEQAITLKSVSGSPVVTEATDFNNGLYLADGSIVTMGPQVIFHTGTMSSVIKSIIRDYSENPGIGPGDMFILNDPYRGAIHQPDVSIVAPVFHMGRHVAWAGSCAHQLDVGGMSFGSWAIGATEIQQEAMLLPGIKLVEGGRLREDLWQMIMGMTRLPHMLGLDLKAMIAANNIAARRLKELMERYGADTVDAIMHTEIDTSERQLRQTLAKLPDGVFRARDYLEHDGHTDKLYQICVAVEKKGDTLTFDMEGTSPQAPGFINCTASGLRGALLTGLLPILAPNIRWNEGVMRPITIKAPEATLCNASWPSPTSAGTVSAAWVVQNVVVAALSRMTACSQATIRDGQAVTKGHMMVMTLAGKDRDGSPFGTFLLDSTAGGGGAFIDHDGLDGSGDYVVPRPCIANVESNESAGPYLYLFREFVPDSGGPGRSRGGAGTALAITPHDVDGLFAMMIGHGVEVPNSAGIFGGMPGSCGRNFLRRGAGDIASIAATGAGLARLDALGLEDLGPKPGHLPLNKGDVIGYTFQGGGGYGDPLRREPARVLADIGNGHVSPGAAERFFGVVTREGAVDQAATDARRAAIRHERIGRTPATRIAVQDSDALAPDLRVSAGRFRCACGEDHGPSHSDWKQRASMRVIAPGGYGPLIRLHPDLEIREFVCGACATLLESEVVRKDQESLVTIALAG